jgi:uncharacterized membrane protein
MMEAASDAAPAVRWRLPRWFLLIVAALAVTVALLTVQVVQLDRALHQTRCNNVKATARAVFNGHDKATTDLVSRAVTAACGGNHQIFGL